MTPNQASAAASRNPANATGPADAAGQATTPCERELADGGVGGGATAPRIEYETGMPPSEQQSGTTGAEEAGPPPISIPCRMMTLGATADGDSAAHTGSEMREAARRWRFGGFRKYGRSAGTSHLGVSVAGMVEVSGLGCAAGRRTVLEGVEFTVRAGEAVGIVGPNGAGKTTLLRTLAGLVTPTSGSVSVDGLALHQVSARERAQLVGLVGQDEQPPADLLVGELVALGRTPYLPPWGAGGPGERAVVEDALRLVDLAGFAGRAVSRLSGGERQRVLLARALAQRTPVLLLDEPTNHLDITHQLELLALARKLAQTVVMSLHDLALADRYCDRVLVVDKGRAYPLEPPETALRPEILDKVFGVRAHRVPDPHAGGTHLIITGRKALS